MTNFRLHDEQSAKGLRKIAWAFIFGFLHTYTNAAVSKKQIYIYIRKTAKEVCFPLSANKKLFWTFVLATNVPIYAKN
jgi:hypothetical protein